MMFRRIVQISPALALAALVLVAAPASAQVRPEFREVYEGSSGCQIASCEPAKAQMAARAQAFCLSGTAPRYAYPEQFGITGTQACMYEQIDAIMYSLNFDYWAQQMEDGAWEYREVRAGEYGETPEVVKRDCNYQWSGYVAKGDYAPLKLCLSWARERASARLAFKLLEAAEAGQQPQP
ncbi:MAG: hypothetical protein NBV68_18760 [Erythrobacter sp.]|uniref:hypothetical protein n=1 Tax=Erythrobacter sp. TaxID=1042 RepID=UPI0025F533A6|nr:hypothetical protein [Erythrobacter sp.]MCM0001418.1 hypothetical protein [Erythrobacter sp.]